MKPSKNKVFCYDCGRIKMLFESEKKANTFIKFNSEEIEDSNGFAPVRSYFCAACNGWHVTHLKADEAPKVSRTDVILSDINSNITNRDNQILIDSLNKAKNMLLPLCKYSCFRRKREQYMRQIEELENKINYGNELLCS